MAIATVVNLFFNQHVTETSITPDSQKRLEFIREAQRIEEATMHSSKGHFAAAAIWRGMHVGLGIPTTILASIAAASAFSKMDFTHSISGWISILVAVLSALTTFLNPPAKANAHFTAGNNYGDLRDKTRMYRKINCLNDSDEALAKRLQELCGEKNELNQTSPQIPWFGRYFAKRGIAAGEAAYEVDKSLPTAN
ncbi:MAG TPA: SLATT domain-containing protein [Verrucomicrobiae bacterium]|nr:SLATT domain-containing protein [Verrucomicrobiae bacterium]